MLCCVNNRKIKLKPLSIESMHVPVATAVLAFVTADVHQKFAHSRVLMHISCHNSPEDLTE